MLTLLFLLLFQQPNLDSTIEIANHCENSIVYEIWSEGQMVKRLKIKANCSKYVPVCGNKWYYLECKSEILDKNYKQLSSGKRLTSGYYSFSETNRFKSWTFELPSGNWLVFNHYCQTNV